MCVHEYVCVSMYVCMYACMYVCMYLQGQDKIDCSLDLIDETALTQLHPSVLHHQDTQHTYKYQLNLPHVAYVPSLFTLYIPSHTTHPHSSHHMYPQARFTIMTVAQ